MSKVKSFPDRVELAVGFPWAIGTGSYKEIQMHSARLIGMGEQLNLKFPKELWEKDVPEYRLVLERVKTKKDVR